MILATFPTRRPLRDYRTPNTNHIGFYFAKAKGLYDAAGLNVRLLSPHVDGYKRTPASRCGPTSLSRHDSRDSLGRSRHC